MNLVQIYLHKNMGLQFRRKRIEVPQLREFFTVMIVSTSKQPVAP